MEARSKVQRNSSSINYALWSFLARGRNIHICFYINSEHLYILNAVFIFNPNNKSHSRTAGLSHGRQGAPLRQNSSLSTAKGEHMLDKESLTRQEPVRAHNPVALQLWCVKIHWWIGGRGTNRVLPLALVWCEPWSHYDPPGTARPAPPSSGPSLHTSASSWEEKRRHVSGVY